MKNNVCSLYKDKISLSFISVIGNRQYFELHINHFLSKREQKKKKQMPSYFKSIHFILIERPKANQFEVKPRIGISRLLLTAIGDDSIAFCYFILLLFLMSTIAHVVPSSNESFLDLGIECALDCSSALTLRKPINTIQYLHNSELINIIRT